MRHRYSFWPFFLTLILLAGCLRPVSPDGVVVDPVDPSPGGKLVAVMVVDENRSEPLPSGVVASMNGEVVQSWLKSHCKEGMSKRYPKVTDLTAQPAEVQSLHADVVEWMSKKSVTLPTIGLRLDKKTMIGPVQSSPQKTLEMLQKYGGK